MIKNVSILTMQDQTEIIENGFVGMKDGKIAYLGAKEPEGYEDAYTIEGKNHVAMPPLVNAHTHSAMVLMRNYADDRELFDWLENAVFPVEGRMGEEDVYWASMLAAYEMIKSGTACFADMYFSSRATAKAVVQSGLRANLNICVSGEVSDNPDRQDAVSFFEEYHNAENGRILVSFAPHAIYTCSAELLQWCARMAADRGVRLHTHVAETKKEYEDCIREHGMTPAAYLNQLGVFDVPAIAAHSLYLDENDLEIYHDKGVTAVYNPTSNCKLASGINTIDRFLEYGVNVALGTDGAASNNNLNLFEEMHMASLLTKGVTLDPCAVPADTALRLATINGARALGFDGVGTLETGNPADLILIDLNKPHLYPMHDLKSAIVYSAQGSDVDTMICDGRILMEKYEVKTLDFEQIKHHIHKSVDKLF